MSTRGASTPQSKSVIVVGAGGNIGSHLVPHLGRMPALAHILLIDRDVYEPANLTGQDITPRDIGKRKALVQARRLKRINPSLEVEWIAGAVEDVPLGRLRGDVILACLDSRRARQVVNEAAWRLGVPWIDAGVDAGGWLARVNVYVPGIGPCLECAWDERDYKALEQSHSCFGLAEKSFSTNAPSSLGALAASLQAIECRKLLLGHIALVAAGRQVLIDASHHKHYVTAIRRNPRCLFPDHEPWAIERLGLRPEQITLGEALKLGARVTGQNGDCALYVAGNRFVANLTCVSCNQSKTLLRLRSSLSSSDQRCSRCAGVMAAAGFDLLDSLDSSNTSEMALSRSLRKIGLRPRDVLTVAGAHQAAHFELGE